MGQLKKTTLFVKLGEKFPKFVMIQMFPANCTTFSQPIFRGKIFPPMERKFLISERYGQLHKTGETWRGNVWRRVQGVYWTFDPGSCQHNL